jgi:hypothetical protein
VPVRKVLLGAAATGLAAVTVLVARVAVERLAMHPALAVREVEVLGAVRIPLEKIRKLADIGLGDPWLSLDGRAARFRISSHPWVQSVRVTRPRPGLVRLRIEECVPIARIVVQGREYGLSRNLRILPGVGEEDALLPLIRGPLGEDPLSRGAAYAEAIQGTWIAGEGPVEFLIGSEAPDQIRLPALGFEASIEDSIPPRSAVQNVAAFLETLDGEGASRGTLRLISEETAVWEAAA